MNYGAIKVKATKTMTVFEYYVAMIPAIRWILISSGNSWLLAGIQIKLSYMKINTSKVLIVLLLSMVYCQLFAQTQKEIEAKRIMLPNGWAVTPVGKSVHLGDLPLNMAVSGSKKLLAVTNNGQSDSDDLPDQILSSRKYWIPYS
jgi:hypothetical protein